MTEGIIFMIWFNFYCSTRSFDSSTSTSCSRLFLARSLLKILKHWAINCRFVKKTQVKKEWTNISRETNRLAFMLYISIRPIIVRSNDWYQRSSPSFLSAATNNWVRTHRSINQRQRQWQQPQPIYKWGTKTYIPAHQLPHFQSNKHISNINTAGTKSSRAATNVMHT